MISSGICLLILFCCCLPTQGNLKCVKLLLAKGANWKAKDNKGRYVLYLEKLNLTMC